MVERAFELEGELCKVDDDLGLAFGWAIVCKVADQTGLLRKYFDTQSHHIPEGAMMKRALDFAKNCRVSGEMHAKTTDGKKLIKGTTPFLFPLTEQIAKSYGIVTKKTGLLIGAAPTPDVLAKFKDGTYTGFSIGGKVLRGGLRKVEVDDSEVVFDGKGAA